jgi:UDP-N-acetylglucosamine--N-acetylmuramyl-(pentapeptide) pyrophosphoryl-undecaprenol N-acetylglucosamine transferase
VKVVIAGGGTGGHVFPGVAIAEELRARDPGAAITVVGTARGLEARVLPAAGWPLELIDVSGLKTVGVAAALRGAARLPRALWQARRLVRRLAPDCVVGVGGYASGPVVLAARLAGVPTAVCEQNSIPGVTNRILGRVARAVFVAFDDSTRFFPARKVAVVGNPVRRDLVHRLLAPAPARTDALVHVLVCGGSQGAVAVNELASAALIALAGERPLAIVHQTGARDRDATAARYAAAGVAAEVHPFITDMASAYLAADLVVGRAGATTVAELALAGKPAVLIPYPHAADNHQELNARAMAEAGAALMLRQAELTAATLADALRPIVSDPARRATMAAAMRRFARPDAAARIVDWCQAQVPA